MPLLRRLYLRHLFRAPIPLSVSRTFTTTPRAPTNLHLHHPRHTPIPTKKQYTTMGSSGALEPSSSPLVWIDCEMTGLDPSKDTIIELCCYITSPTLTVLTPTPFHAILHAPAPLLASMDAWCTSTHAASGLTSLVQASRLTAATVQPQLMEFIKRHVPYAGYGLLAGNSVHADRMFLSREFPEVVGWLHHRIVDVSSFKECVRMWCGREVLRGVPRKRAVHRAREDILESIEEMRYYKKVFFDGK